MFSNDRKSRESGFTLAEALVATAIFAIIFIAALLVYDRSNKVFKSGVEAADMQQNTRVAFDKLVADVRLAGYDFDRDGVPTLAGEAQQPDEQIEYAGPHALTLRANFNYNDAEAGRDASLEIPNSEFPVVTTSNDEIVTYALVPDAPGATTETLTFFADVTDGSAPARQAYPGGEAEDTISISGVDLCADGCNQPPYTLYRFTVNDQGGVERTPLASNIRNLTFEYFNDLTGTSPLAITDAGGGKVDPATPASVNHAARVKRAEIKSIRVTLIGLNEADDQNWRQAGETSTAVEKRRQYELSSIVIPRNLGKRGMREQQTSAPNPPLLKSVCFNYCGLVQVTWDPPAQGAGEVETYYVLWDTDIGATDPPDESQPVGLSTTAFIAGLDPTTTYRFGVAATNSFGQSYSTEFVEGKPLNDTTPDVATLDSVTDSPSPLENMIRLEWTLPTTNVAGSANCITPAGAASTAVAVPQPGEMQGIEIWRSTDPNFDPAVASPSTVKVATAPALAGSYDDVSAANCVDYYYRIRVVEGCGIDPTKNVGTNFGRSAFDPPVGTAAIKGRAESTKEPSQPAPLVVDGASESCTGPNCTFTVAWPAVTTNVVGEQIAVDRYTLLIHDNVAGTDEERAISIAAGQATLSGGTVSHTISPTLTKQTPAYDISVRAEQCGVAGAYSASDKWPKCVFASGSALDVAVSGVNAGSGSAADPYEVVGAESITFSVASGTLTEVTASLYNAETGAKVLDFAPVTGASNSLVLGFDAPEENTTFRVDYVVKDGATPACTQSGSVYIRDVVVTCPFEAISSPNAVNLNAPSSVEFSLKNLTNFDITFVRAEVTWSEELAITDAKSDSATVTKVEVPPVSGSSPVTAILTGTTTGTGTFTASSGSAKKIFANDMTGNWVMEIFVTVEGKGNKTVPMAANPINKIDIFYKLPGDTDADLARVCTVYTQ